MKVLDRERLVTEVVNRASESGCSEGRIYSLRKVAENARELRLEDKKALVLMGMNVYTVESDDFVNAVKSLFNEIEEEDFREESMIKELDKEDKRIYKK